MNETLIFILKYATDIVATLLLIRFLLQLSQADFYNPVSQGILKICRPIAAPLEKLIPAMGRFNLAVLATALAKPAPNKFSTLALSLNARLNARCLPITPD